MKFQKRFIGTLICILSLLAHARAQRVIVPDNLRLPGDTVEWSLLLSSLNGLLDLDAADNKATSFVLDADMPATTALMDEMKGIVASGKYKDNDFYKCYLNNVTKLDAATYLIQISFIGVNEGVPLYRAGFTLLAKKNGRQFYFCTPLVRNTIAWKRKEVRGTNVYYKHTLNTSNARAYFGRISAYDKKLGAPPHTTDFYCADNFHEALQLLGVDYKSDYNGMAHNSLSADFAGRSLSVNGTLTADFTKFDPHDLWHERLHKVLAVSIINRPVDEGTAYLYGGSWGLTWHEILNKFKTYAHAHPDADWISLYNESRNFNEPAKFPLNVDFVINALIVQKIESEKGFSSVIELLSCGKKEKNNDNYFVALEKITGISKANFNSSVWGLINAK
jgi:hypothetical protein